MKMSKEQLFGIIRHVMSAAAGYLIYRGYLTEDQAAEISGAILAIMATVWSVGSK
jgi:hypothetical protein